MNLDDPAVVFRVAVVLGATAVIVAHNHPSGDTTPSPEDKAVTRDLKKAGKVLEIKLLDHLIVTSDPDEWFSFANSGQL